MRHLPRSGAPGARPGTRHRRTLAEQPAALGAQALGGEATRIHFEAVVMVAAPQGLAHVAQRERSHGLKLVNVPKLVQE